MQASEATGTVREDAAMAALLAAHAGLSPEQSATLDRRLVLLLASGRDVAEAVRVARVGLGDAATEHGTATPLLHHAPRSSASYRVRIALALKNIGYTPQAVALDSGAQRSADFKALNPQSKVPVLEIDGLVLTQSLAIIAYLEATRPNPALMPAEPGARARLTAIAHALCMEVAPLCSPAVAAHAAKLAGSGEAGRESWVRHFMSRGLAAVEIMLADRSAGPFAHGDAPGLVDCCIVPQLYNARRWGVDLGPLARLRAIDAACTALPAFARAHPDHVTEP